MHGELAVPVLFDSVYDFIEEDIFPSVAWLEFEETFREYRVSRSATIHAYIDTLPTLTFVAAGDLPKRAMPLAAAWVFYLFASKIFDDIQDKDDQEELWNKGGIWTALPAGLFALGGAKASLAKLETDSDTYAAILGAFGNAMALAAKAQSRQLTLETLRVASYFKIVAAKTGLIFATGAWSGARLASIKLDSDELERFYQYGLNVGIAGQVLDDCLDLGKGDLANNTFTLPIIYGLSQEQHPQQSQLLAALRDLELENSNDQVPIVMDILQEMGAIEWSLQVAKAYGGRALAALQGLPQDRIRPLVEYATGNHHVAF